MAIIDANDLILGRFATVVAKRALLGETMDIVNCEKAVITGNKKSILEKYKVRRARGIPSKGPFYPRRSDMLIRRTIRGMLPYKKPKGRDAYKRVKCHIGLPKELEGKQLETIDSANVSKVKTLRFVRLESISKLLGAKQ